MIFVDDEVAELKSRDLFSDNSFHIQDYFCAIYHRQTGWLTADNCYGEI